MNPEARRRAARPCLEGSKSRNRLSEILAWSVLVWGTAVVLQREAPMIQRSILLLLGGACVATAASAQQPKKLDVRAIAHQLIASTLLQEGQSVLITGSVRDAGLMEDLAIEARKAGAQPMLVISSERLIRRSYDERSEERRVGKECRSRWSPYH